MIRERELTASPQDIVVLERFYSELYLAQFPDPNERESLENMCRYLELKATGWYGKNNYHILILEDSNDIVGGSVSDYLVDANAGIIEFLVVSPAMRKKGIGERLLRWTEQTIKDDARKNLGCGPCCIAAEMNDPFKTCNGEDNFNTFDRTEIWGRWGYKKIDFPYVQPALSSDQKPVHHLLLMAKPFIREFESFMPAALVEVMVREYMRWAMRISEPEQSAVYREMRDYLNRVRSVPLVPLLQYIGQDETSPILVHEINSADSSELQSVLSVYTAAFSERKTSVKPDFFRQFVNDTSRQPYSYHLWALRTAASDEVSGMASFFTFPGAGFGGYIAFDVNWRGQGRLRPVIASIERAMIEDGNGARGWYIECSSSALAAVFHRIGFSEIAITYRQPPLCGSPPYSLGEAPVLRLMYKEFGSTYYRPEVNRDEFLAALKWIYRTVYCIETPQESLFFQDVVSRLSTHGEELISFK